MSDEYLLGGYPTDPFLGGAVKFINDGMVRKFTDKVTGHRISKMAGGSEMGVIETVFAEVLARLIIIVILLALAYYGFMFVYEEYLKDFIASFKSVMNKIVDMLKKITDLLGGGLGAAGNVIGGAASAASKVPGAKEATGALKDLFDL
jgi:TM2 domain-containing membrane protein YozV